MKEDDDTHDWNEFVKEVKIAFSNKSKATDAEWKIKTFQQRKKHIADFMIEFKVLAMKAETDGIHAIFLLKKNVRSNIIKTIRKYSPIIALETLKEWKIAIISVRQSSKSIENKNDHRTGTGITYGDRGVSM